MKKSKGARVGRVVSVDTDTGELLENTPVYFAPKYQNGFERHLAMSQNAFDKISEDREMTQEMNRVFHKALGRLDWQNYLWVNQADMAKELGMQRTNVNRAIKALVRKGILLQGVKVNRCWTYRLNPNYGWKGQAKKHHEALKEHNFRVIDGGKRTDAEERAELENQGGQQRMEFDHEND